MFFALLLLLSATAPQARAQEVYNLVLENATRIVNSPTANFTQTRVAQFKLTALVYMKKKAFETKAEVSSELLNTQAYYLSEFLSLFFDELLKDRKATAETRKKVLFLFMDASLSNPLFGDTDEDTTQAYIKEGSEITPFSLDTDWEKAYAAAKSQIK